MSHVTFNRSGQGITMAAIVHFPPHFDECKGGTGGRGFPPGGGVKEQTAGLTPAKAGRAGGSSPSPLTAPIRARAPGEPRRLENPHVSDRGRQRRGGTT